MKEQCNPTPPIDISTVRRRTYQPNPRLPSGVSLTGRALGASNPGFDPPLLTVPHLNLVNEILERDVISGVLFLVPLGVSDESGVSLPHTTPILNELNAHPGTLPQIIRAWLEATGVSLASVVQVERVPLVGMYGCEWRPYRLCRL